MVGGSGALMLCGEGFGKRDPYNQDSSRVNFGDWGREAQTPFLFRLVAVWQQLILHYVRRKSMKPKKKLLCCCLMENCKVW